MAIQTLSNISGMLKNLYIGPIRDQLNNATVLFNRLEKNEEDVHGADLKAYIPLFHKRNQGIGWRSEGGTLPTADRRTHTQTSIAMAYLYGQIKISGQAIRGTRNAATAFAKVVTNEVRGMVEGLKLEVNRALWRDGSGYLSQVNQATGSVTADVLFSVDDASHFEPGMVVDTYAAKSGGSVVLDSKTVSEVDVLNNKISLSTTETITNDHFIFREDSRGLVMMGIEGIIDGADSTATRIVTTLQGINRSTAGNKFWESPVIDNGGANQSLAITRIQQAYEIPEIVGQGHCSIIMSGYALRRAYFDLMAVDKRYVNSLKLDGGWQALEYTGGGGATPWVVDRMAKPKSIYFIDERTLAIYRAADFDWMDLDGAVLRKVSDKDEYEGTCFSYVNLGCSGCNKNSVLRDQV